MAYGNSRSESFAALGKKRAAKPYGKGMAEKHAGILSPQCKAGMHHMCIKKHCPCLCGHKGIR